MAQKITSLLLGIALMATTSHTSFVQSTYADSNTMAEAACYTALQNEMAPLITEAASPKDYAAFHGQSAIITSQRDPLTTLFFAGFPIQMENFDFGAQFGGTASDFFPVIRTLNLIEHDTAPLTKYRMSMVYFDDHETGKRFSYCYGYVYNILDTNIQPAEMKGGEVGLLRPPHEMSVETISTPQVYKKYHTKIVIPDITYKHALLERTEIAIIPQASNSIFSPYDIIDAIHDGFSTFHKKYVPDIKKFQAEHPDTFEVVRTTQGGAKLVFGSSYSNSYGINPSLIDNEVSYTDYGILINFFAIKHMLMSGQMSATKIWLSWGGGKGDDRSKQKNTDFLSVFTKDQRADEIKTETLRPKLFLMENTHSLATMATLEASAEKIPSPEKSPAAKTFWKLDQLKKHYTNPKTGEADEKQFITAAKQYLASARTQQRFDTANTVGAEPTLTEVALEKSSILGKLGGAAVMILVLAGCYYVAWLVIRKK